METLKNSPQFDRVRREGRSWASRYIVLNAAPNGLETLRCGFLVGKKVGGAVERNRARRLLREAVRGILSQVKPGWDLVWIARNGLDEAHYNDVASDVRELLVRGNLISVVNIETEGSQSRIIEQRAALEAAPPNQIAGGRPKP